MRLAKVESAGAKASSKTIKVKTEFPAASQRLIFALRVATMSQKSSVLQVMHSVQSALMSDTSVAGHVEK
jgi:hypothetical protein